MVQQIRASHAALARAKLPTHIASMTVNYPKRPRDLNQWAKQMVDLATGHGTAPQPTTKNQAAVELGRKGGLKGGKARANSLSPQQRRAIAKRAATKRWGKSKA